MSQKDPFRIDFIGIGSAKAGTTWVAEILRQHPGVYYPTARKELNYFNALMPQDYATPNAEHTKGLDWYHAFFAGRAEGQVSGEITPSYLDMPGCAAAIRAYHPGIKLFAILRHPVERSFSQYLFSRQNGIGRYRDYEDALAQNPRKFINTSLYHRHLQDYLAHFPAGQIKVFIYEDMRADNRAFLEELYAFLGLPAFFPDNLGEKVNVGLQPKNQALNSAIGQAKMFLHRSGLQGLLPILQKTGLLGAVKRAKQRNMVARQGQEERLAPATRQRLIAEHFLADVEALEKLLGKDLSAWKK